MTFRAERYAPNWREIRAMIIARAGERCECTGQCGHKHSDGRCGVPNRARINRGIDFPWRWMREDDRFDLLESDYVSLAEEAYQYSDDAIRVVLTVAHIDHDESNNDPANLLAMCQFCHLSMDREDNARRRRENIRVKCAAGELPGMRGAK